MKEKNVGLPKYNDSSGCSVRGSDRLRSQSSALFHFFCTVLLCSLKSPVGLFGSSSESEEEDSEANLFGVSSLSILLIVLSIKLMCLEYATGFSK